MYGEYHKIFTQMYGLDEKTVVNKDLTTRLCIITSNFVNNIKALLRMGKAFEQFRSSNQLAKKINVYLSSL